MPDQNNTFKNTKLVTRFGVKEFRNALMLATKVDRQLDTSRVFTGKVGATVDIRRPVMFTASDGATFANKDIEEAIVPAILNQRKHVGFTVTDTDLTLEIAEANERYIKPAMIELAQKVESAIAQSYDEVPIFVGTPGVSPGTFLDVAKAKAALSEIGVPMTDRVAFFDSDATVTLSDGLKAVFPQEIAKTAIQEASIGRYGGFDIFENQSLKIHTVGDHDGTPAINGANQSTEYKDVKDTDSQTINIDGWDMDNSNKLNKGDILTFGDVNSVNQRTREDTGKLAQFVVLADTADVAGVTATLPIAPPIIVSGPYQTVTKAPDDNATVTVKTGVAKSKHRQNLAWHPNGITFFMAQLDVPSAGVEAHRESFDGISMLVTKQFDIKEMETVMRFDIFFGVKVQNRRFIARITS